jgi:Cu/Ag efflux protein CusF
MTEEYDMKIRIGWKAAAVVIGMVSAVWAAEVSQTVSRAPKSEPPRGEVTTQVTVQATVQKINYKTRMITLKDETGEVSEMKVGPEVQRFNDIKKGDVLAVDYLESTALYVHKAEKGEKPSYDVGAEAVRLAGQKPGAQVGATERISAEVLKVDYKHRKITLKGPEGNVETMNVPDEVKRLNEIKKGDHVVVEHTLSVIIGVRKP